VSEKTEEEFMKK